MVHLSRPARVGALCAALLLGAAAYSRLAPDPEPVPAAPAPVVLSAGAPEGDHVVTLGVDGMLCGGCASKVYRALNGVAGVREAAVDVTVGRAQAVVPASMDVETVAEAVALEGLTFRPLE